MCRIAGIYNPNSSSLQEDILRMRDSMHRGGPDGAGIYINTDKGFAFGHRRLALLDLSDAGHQPMASVDGNIYIIFNGEIYNFLELKHLLESEGCIFTTQTDTEVIIKAYEKWGTQCFAKFNGMFALAIWDNKNSIIILARDYAGIKPLYYHISSKELIFASEVRAFKAFNAKWEENKDWKIPFLAYGHLPEPFTTLENVIPLQKGNYAVIDIPSLNISIKSFYEYSYTSEIITTDKAKEALKDAIERAVERQLISDAPIGVFLSGGIDSSILTILAAKFKTDKLKTLSIIFEEQDFSEESYQKIVVDQTLVEHHSFLVTNKMFRDEFVDIMDAMDQPSIDGINTYFICKFAKQYGLTAVLSGLGADELFGGYDSIMRSNIIKQLLLIPSFALSLFAYIPNDRLKRISHLKNKNNKYLFYRGVYHPIQISKILNISIKEIEKVLNKVQITPSNIKSESQNAAHVEQHLYMQNQLLKDTDYMSMWHSVEVRVPFLDKAVIDVVNKISPKLKFDFNKRPKWLLIDTFKNILPREIWDRKKQGFSFPLAKWINHIVPLSRGFGFEKNYQKLNKSLIHWSKYWSFILATTNQNNLVFLQDKFNRVCFYNLDAFASMGGIEKFNRALLFAFDTLEKESYVFIDAVSMYDNHVEYNYFSSNNYKKYNKNKLKFIYTELFSVHKYNQIILGHVNLALFGLLVKLLYPNKKIYIVAHGKEVWPKLVGFKKIIFKQCDEVLCVSNFTKDKLVEINEVNENKIRVFPNTIDPFFTYPTQFKKPVHLLERYGLRDDDKILFTLTRLAYSEKYKGYDKVIEVLPEVLKIYPNAKYLIAGKSDEEEKSRLKGIIKNNKLENNCFLLGYISDDESTQHYQLADLFIMPSKKEGFGIVFIEAMACGLPVIAGNQDGSVDALLNGELGTLINPDDKQQIINSICKVLGSESYNENQKKLLQKNVETHFGFPQFYNNLKKVIVNEYA